MAKVRGKDSRGEMTLRSLLHRKGFRFRKNTRRLPGTPDVLLPKYHAAIFVHGCFWHGHTDCRKGRLPTSRADYWPTKIEANRERDRRKTADLTGLGWRVAVVWGCALATNKATEDTLNMLEKWIMRGEEFIEIPDAVQDGN